MDTITEDTTAEHVQRFALVGDVWPLQYLGKAEGDVSWRPTRPMGGWLATYGKIGKDGGIVPTRDRDGHVLEAARQIGYIDWKEYIKGGVWNDTHDKQTIVGLPTSLEFHDDTTELAKAHGKVGFWTTGHLFDKEDPKSWEGLTDGHGNTRMPAAHEFLKADYFWALAHLLKGTPRPLGLSAEGLMALSACRQRIMWARVAKAAVCETPVNPDTTVEPMIYAVMGEAKVEGHACAGCGKCTDMAKGGGLDDLHPGGERFATVTPQYGDAGIQRPLTDPKIRDRLVNDKEFRSRVVELIATWWNLSRRDAERWVLDYLRRVTQRSSNARGKEAA